MAAVAPLSSSPYTASPAFEATRRKSQMRRALMFYQGTTPDSLRWQPGGPDDNIKVGFGRLIVDKGASFLFGADVVSQVPGPQAEPAQDWLDEVWRRSKRALLLQKLAVNGAITGHAFVKILPARPYPRLIVLDPTMVEVVTDPDDLETVTGYTITLEQQGQGQSGTQRRQVITREEGDAGRVTWRIVDQIKHGEIWATTGTTPWPYDWAPVVDCQNMPAPNDFWGTPDLSEDILHLISAINRVASHYNKIIRIHAHPKTWARGMGAKSIDNAIDAVLMLPSETAELHNLEMTSDLHSTAELLDRLLDYLSFVTRIPTAAFGLPDKQGALSGVALQIRYQPLLEKTELKRRTYGLLLQETERRLLVLGDFGDGIVTTQHWPPLLPADPVAQRQTLAMDKELGIASQHTISDRLGYDWDDEQAKIAEEKAVLAATMPAAAAVPGADPVGPGAGTPIGAEDTLGVPLIPKMPKQGTVPSTESGSDASGV